MGPPQRTLRNVFFGALFLLWIGIFFLFERVIPKLTADNCEWPEKGDQILFVADPQLIDNHTYPGRHPALLKLSQHTVDNYIRKNYRALVETLHPHSVIFLGDLMDNGRSSSEEYYKSQLARFDGIFRADAMELITNVPGNHDIGWAQGVKLDSLNRFQQHFGATNKIIQRDGFDIVFLDSISLSNTENEAIFQPPRTFLDKLQTQENHRPRILVSHVPLYRSQEVSCGPMRESLRFPVGGFGYQYQNNIDEKLSLEILSKVRPTVVLSGDDHDYCDVVHEYRDPSTDEMHQAREITVKSISMAMGIKRPAVQLVSLTKEGNVATDICYLPKPYVEVVVYGISAAISAVMIFLYVLYRSKRAGLHRQRHGVSEKVREFLFRQQIEEQSSAEQIAVEPREERIYNYKPRGGSKKTRIRLWSFLWHCLIMAILVVASYAIFTL